jgi:hypothetical protein
MRIPILLATLALVVGCSDTQDRTSAGPGNGSETEARLLDLDGEPIAAARFVVGPRGWSADADGNASAGVDTFDLLADSEGRFRIPLPSTGEASVQVLQGQEGVLADLDERTQRVVLRMRPLGLIRGRAPTEGATWVRVGVAGSGFQANVGSDGIWTLRGVPSQRVDLIAWRAAGSPAVVGRQVLVPENDTVDAGILVPPDNLLQGEVLRTDSGQAALTDSVLILDFEGPRAGTHHRFAALTGHGIWWISDSGNRMEVPLRRNDLSAALDSGPGSFRGRSLTMRRVAAGANSVFGIEFDRTHKDSGYVWHDLTDLDSFVFWAKGTGRLTVKAHGTWEASPATWYGADVVLDSVWRRYAVAADSQVTATVGAPPWRERADSSQGIAFVRADTGRFWIDDVVLKGIGPATIWPRLLGP